MNTTTTNIIESGGIRNEPFARVRFLPEIDRMRAENQTEADIKADMLKTAADLLDAQADFIQTLIDRCKAATITHEELVVRLTKGLQNARLAAGAARFAGATVLPFVKRGE
jgi:hypothetical protein